MNKRLLYVCCLIMACIAFFSQCINGPGKDKDADLRGEKFAGAAACTSCHKNRYDSWLATAHHATSGPASKTTIKGRFTPDANTFVYKDNRKVIMEDKANGFFQSGYTGNDLRESHAFDVVIGSGTKAQTYLYWDNGKYFQLPVSYFVAAHSWANSPGFPDDHPKFDRLIPSTCFGCHSSMVALKSTKLEGLNLTEEFEKNQVTYGIDCERCHGPAAAHVQFHTEHPQEKKPMYITAIASLKNEQKLDMCGICHSGLKTVQKSMFDFRPGDSVSDYFYPDFTKATRATEMDVHGTQYQLFTASKCYRKSVSMNCSSCHNPHIDEKNNMQAFNQKCMSCHTADNHNFCTNRSVPPATLVQNCVDCHMPALPSGKITLLTNGKMSPTPDNIRTHLITIYPEESDKVIARLLKKD